MSLASLADVVPGGLVRPVAEWYLRELEEIIKDRGIEYERMRRLGVNGSDLHAFTRATSCFSDVQARWQRALKVAA